VAFEQGVGRILVRAEAELRSKQAGRRRVESDPRAGDQARQMASKDEEDAGQAVEYLRNQARQAHLKVRQSRQMAARARRQLARMLNIPAAQAESIELSGRLRELPDLPASPEALIQAAYESRPDLVAYRLGLSRARADVRLAKANRMSDVYLVYQPFTDQSLRAFGTKDTYS
jgi:cobalt-zinc-cadmium efflux system outer membrane protein